MSRVLFIYEDKRLMIQSIYQSPASQSFTMSGIISSFRGDFDSINNITLVGHGNTKITKGHIKMYKLM